MLTKVLIVVLLAFGSFGQKSPKSELKRKFVIEEYIGSTDLPEEDVVDASDVASKLLPNQEDVVFRLYTNSNPKQPELIQKVEDLKTSKVYSKGRKNVFLIHGWKNDYKSLMYQEILTAIFSTPQQAKNFNVFTVDWSHKSMQLYLLARYSVPEIGRKVGEFINNQMLAFNLTPDKFALIGHSLGAHVAGIAGQTTNGLVDLIVGLDPAKPLFSLFDRPSCLDDTDASFVQIIHTNGGLLGIKSAMGHADYYPNGGEWQNGCLFDLSGSCSHARSYEYFAESIRRGGFTGFQCKNEIDFSKGICFGNKRSYMGRLNVDKNASGDFYLATYSKRPYSIF